MRRRCVQNGWHSLCVKGAKGVSHLLLWFLIAVMALLALPAVLLLLGVFGMWSAANRFAAWMERKGYAA